MLLGLDLGTSAVKGLVVNPDGDVIGRASGGYPLRTPYPGWAEQDAEQWWEACLAVIRNLLAQPGVHAKAIRAIAVSGQMHGSVFLDQAGQVVRPPILWCDCRTTKQCASITRTLGEQRLLDLVGNVAFEGFTAPKILWLREEEPASYARTRTLLLPKDYIVWRLAGEKVTEASDASGTLLFDVKGRQWSAEMIQALEVDPSWLPDVLESPSRVGRLTPEAARETGLPLSATVVAGGADNACSAVGNGVTGGGTTLVSVGSSGTVLAPTPQYVQSSRGRLHTFCHASPDMWYVMGVTLSAGLSLEWYKNSLTSPPHQASASYSDIEADASRAPAGCRGLVFLPYLNGERTPHRDATARGAFIGLTAQHRSSDLARAVFEGVAFALRASLDLVCKAGVPTSEIRLTGGGAQSPLWSAILANVLSSPVAIGSRDDGAALGAALIAATGIGLFADVREAAAQGVRTEMRVDPDAATVSRYDDLYRLFTPLYGNLREVFAALRQFADRGKNES